MGFILEYDMANDDICFTHAHGEINMVRKKCSTRRSHNISSLVQYLSTATHMELNEPSWVILESLETAEDEYRSI